ncbi:hypothetical protein OG2516_17216 [Oceanicola granulosus HTCC2516]|uniref:Uncharacterized protein n=1 Tax=Oceanicola granulosus (strain ATCC BAA-861 / DSM 15982 / KCTC 12143 / HTCC2516) TaxID=314256 RepID=Q2CFK0_OCEGH|nr:DUF1467 family protein [Oceanicola granulosus]EAR51482.1 hypothetical protein OG2516_17216 [Oceanicola granulosus HTCC2516]
MGIVSGIVLFIVVWVLVFFVVLPLRLETQGDSGDVVPGTHRSAPADFRLGRKALLATYFAVPIFAVLATIIVTGAIGVRDFDWFGNMTSAPLSAD